MRARRTVRGFINKPVTLDEIGTCLFAGLGIVGFYEHDDLGRMPLKMTPSGGARNPFEAYVYPAVSMVWRVGFTTIRRSITRWRRCREAVYRVPADCSRANAGPMTTPRLCSQLPISGARCGNMITPEAIGW